MRHYEYDRRIRVSIDNESYSTIKELITEVLASKGTPLYEFKAQALAELMREQFVSKKLQDIDPEFYDEIKDKVITWILGENEETSDKVVIIIPFQMESDGTLKVCRRDPELGKFYIED